jgi:hypothetical protein
VRRDGAVLIVHILAPPMNLLGPELVRDLVTLFARAEPDDTVRVLVHVHDVGTAPVCTVRDVGIGHALRCGDHLGQRREGAILVRLIRTIVGTPTVDHTETVGRHGTTPTVCGDGPGAEKIMRTIP